MNVVGRRESRNSQFYGLQCNSSIASWDVKKNDEYLDGMLKNVHPLVDLVEPVVHGFQSSPHRPCKTRQHEGKEDRGNDILDRLAD